MDALTQTVPAKHRGDGSGDTMLKKNLKTCKTIFMKKYFTALLILLAQIYALSAVAQAEKQGIMVRVSEDNDFLNDNGRGTDNAYTNGTRIDIFYAKNHKSKLFLDRWMPKAGSNAINTFGVGLMQVMYTPNNITSKLYQPKDYPWSASLYAAHTLYSYDPVKKYGFQTEIAAGIIGPEALGREAQSVVHGIIHDAIPQGWGNQFGNDALLNVNFTVEKELMHFHNYFELIGSGQASVGTMTDALDIAPVFLAGIMSPYFNGFMGHLSSTGKKKLQVYLKFKPGVQLVGWNASLEGGMFDRSYSVKSAESAPDQSGATNDEYIKGPHPKIENVVAYASYGLVIVYSRFSISYLQIHNTQLIENTYAHTYGNVTATCNL
jgi:hypothetical protein